MNPIERERSTEICVRWRASSRTRGGSMHSDLKVRFWEEILTGDVLDERNVIDNFNVENWVWMTEDEAFPKVRLDMTTERRVDKRLDGGALPVLRDATGARDGRVVREGV